MLVLTRILILNVKVLRLELDWMGIRHDEVYCFQHKFNSQ
jgi:hypothetical protein